MRLFNDLKKWNNEALDLIGQIPEMKALVSKHQREIVKVTRKHPFGLMSDEVKKELLTAQQNYCVPFTDEQLDYCVTSGKTPPQFRDRINEAIAAKIELYNSA